MSTSKSSASYPQFYLDAVNAAFAGSEDLVIPHPKPRALNLQFNGLRAALRGEGCADIIDQLSFHVRDNPPSLVLKRKDLSTDTLAIEAALKVYNKLPQSSKTADAEDAADAMLSRLLSKAPI